MFLDVQNHQIQEKYPKLHDINNILNKNETPVKKNTILQNRNNANIIILKNIIIDETNLKSMTNLEKILRVQTLLR